MMDVNNTTTNDYYLCSDCAFNSLTCYKRRSDEQSGIFFCQRFSRAVANVGICKYYIRKGGTYDRSAT